MYRAICFAVIFAGNATSNAWAERIPPSPVGGKIDWVYNYEEGKERARKNGKPLFVVFRCER